MNAMFPLKLCYFNTYNHVGICSFLFYFLLLMISLKLFPFLFLFKIGFKQSNTYTYWHTNILHASRFPTYIHTYLLVYSYHSVLLGSLLYGLGLPLLPLVQDFVHCSLVVPVPFVASLRLLSFYASSSLMSRTVVRTPIFFYWSSSSFVI